MNKVGKSVVFIISVISIIAFVISLVGISTKYGDITTIIINGKKQIRNGLGFKSELKIVLRAQDDATEEQLSDAADIISKRMASYTAIGEYEVYYSSDSGNIEVIMPWSTSDGYNIIYDLESRLISKSCFTVREGEIQNTDGTPGGKTAERVLISNNDIESASANTGNDLYGNTTYYIKAFLTDEAKTEYFARLDEMYKENRAATISFWLDDTMVDSMTVYDALASRSDYLSIYSDSITSSNCSIYASAIEIGAIDIDLSAANTVYDGNAGFGGDKIELALIIGCIAVFAIFTAAEIVRRGLFGICTVISLLGSYAVMMFTATGFIGGIASQYLTAISSASFVIAMFVACVVSASEEERIIFGITEKGYSRNKAITSAFKESTSFEIKIYACLAVVGVVCVLFFARQNGAFFGLVSGIIPSADSVSAVTVKYFGVVLTAAAVSGMVFVILLRRLMVKSLSNNDRIDDKTMFKGSIKAATTEIINTKKIFIVFGAIFAVSLAILVVFGFGNSRQYSGTTSVYINVAGDYSVEESEYMKTVNDCVKSVIGNGWKTKNTVNELTLRNSVEISHFGNYDIDTADFDALINEKLPGFADGASFTVKTEPIYKFADYITAILGYISVIAIAFILFVLFTPNRFGFKFIGYTMLSLLLGLFMMLSVALIIRIPANESLIAGIVTATAASLIYGASSVKELVTKCDVSDKKRLFDSIVSGVACGEANKYFETAVIALLSCVAFAIVAVCLKAVGLAWLAVSFGIGIVTAYITAVVLIPSVWYKFEK